MIIPIVDLKAKKIGKICNICIINIQHVFRGHFGRPGTVTNVFIVTEVQQPLNEHTWVFFGLR